MIKKIVVLTTISLAMFLSSCSKDPEPTNIAPIAVGTVDKTSGRVGDTFTFGSSSSSDPDGNDSNLKASWDFDGDGTPETGFDSYLVTPTHTFDAASTYRPILKVKDEDGLVTTKTLSAITVTGNVAPTAAGTINKGSVEIGESVEFDGSDSNDPDGDNSQMQSRIDFDGDGVFDSEFAPYNRVVNHQFNVAGNYNPIIEVKDVDGAVAQKVLANLGVYDPVNNPISNNFKVPKYMVAGQQVIATADATDANGRPIEYDFDLDGNGDFEINDGASQQSFTPTRGKKTLKSLLTNDYNVSNTKIKDVEVGPEIPSILPLTGADGEVYKVNVMNDGTFWLAESYRGKVGDADFYDNDSISNSVFGRYYSAAEIDEIGRVELKLANGEVRYAHVASEEEWNSLIDTYGGTGVGAADLKYNAFANGDNYGAKDNSKLSLMLSGANNDEVGYGELGNFGLYMTATDNSNESKKTCYVNKDNANIGILTGVPNSTRAPVRLVVEPKQF